MDKETPFFEGDPDDDSRTLVVDGKRVGGTEHHVMIDWEKRIVRKFPKPLGLLFQEMDPETIKENPVILRRHNLPILPTRIRWNPRVSYPERVPFVQRVVQGPTEMARRIVMGFHNQKNVAAFREALHRKFEKPIGFFRRLYTRTVGWEIIDMVKDFMNTERLAKKTRKAVKYILEQPLFEPAHPMTFGDLAGNRSYRDLVYRCISESEDILKNPEEQRGLDLLGGKAFKLVFPALNPFCKAMRAEISNLMVADEQIKTEHHWGGFDLPDGVLAEKGDAVLIDTGMYKLAPKPGVLSWLKIKILKNIQEFQNGALWSIVESFGEHEVAEDRFNSIPRKIARFLFGIALPKMKRGAEQF
ncbi:hypothetical protein JXA05_00385 [Candidatus Peregrinibacteria bacterium]|nr:hypothetical protein [Candidatus Peregrinibacteria bacterium]